MKNIKAALVKKSAMMTLKIKKYSPEILIVVGAASIIGGTILACKATLKVESIVDAANEKIEKIKDVELQDREDYSSKDAGKDRAIVSTQTVVELIKLYSPATILIVGGIGCMVKSHNIMQKRNLALIAAYKVLDDAFKTYRKSIVEEYGEEIDAKIKQGIRVTDKKDVDGNVTEEAGTVNTNNISQYAKFFDECNINWSKTPEYNLMYLRAQQNRANDMLHARGHVFLNEVYDLLNIDRTQAGAMVGWVVGEGDDFIDFGVYKGDEKSRDFVNGIERSILLDFNVDGVIYDLI